MTNSARSRPFSAGKAELSYWFMVEEGLEKLGCKEAKGLLSELAAKAQQIHSVRKSIAGIMAKKIGNKEKIRSGGFINLKDIKDLSGYGRSSKNARWLTAHKPACCRQKKGVCKRLRHADLRILRPLLADS